MSVSAITDDTKINVDPVLGNADFDGTYTIDIGDETMNNEHNISLYDNKGYVSLVDHMGNDFDVYKKASICYGLDPSVDTSPETIKRVLFNLIKNEHVSPFEHVVFEFKMKIPVFVDRQFVRTRTARRVERSARYTKFKGLDNIFTPEFERISDSGVGTGESNKELMDELNEKAVQTYNTLLENGVKKEVARMVLPLSMMTEFYWQIDGNNLLKFLELRDEEHAQYEIRQLAQAIRKLVSSIIPITLEAFDEHVKFAHTFSKTECDILSEFIDRVEEDMRNQIIDNLIEKHGKAKIVPIIGRLTDYLE